MCQWRRHIQFDFTSPFSSDDDSVVEVVVPAVVDGVLPNISAVAFTACTFGNTNTTAEKCGK